MLPVLKTILIICVFICVILTPAYLAAMNDKSKYDCMRARCASWLFGWSIVGWLFALFVSAKK
ncbi:MAG: hypothetical protein IKN73_03235 [Alphaproteobacteria bacterium]|nr:hypothetical protein [Alphaproteobacteria bacterium]